MRRPTPRVRLVLLSSCLLALAACASSHMLVGTPRAAIAPEQVRIYQDPPDVPFEEIALLDVSSGAFTYGEQNKTDAVMERLRKEAAKVGANGVIFGGTARGYGNGGVSIGAGGGNYGHHSYGGVGVGVDISPQQKYARGTAIYVPNPPPPASTPPASTP